MQEQNQMNIKSVPTLKVFFTVFLLLPFLSGCSTFPNNIASPKVALVENSKTQKATYSLGKNEIRYGSSSTTASTILPVETTIEGVKSQIMAFRGAYENRRVELLREIDISNNLQLLGILAAAAGVAKSDLDLQKGGATVAGLSTFYSSHFKLAIQANNYKVGATAMECIYRKIDSIPDLFFRKVFPGGTLIIRRDEIDAIPSSQKEKAYDTLLHLFTSLNDTVYKTDQKLRGLQSSSLIATAQISDIQGAIDSSIKSKEVAAPIPVDSLNILKIKSAIAFEASKRVSISSISPSDETPEAKIKREKAAEKAKLDAEKRIEDLNAVLVDEELFSKLVDLPVSVELCVTPLGSQ
jgi:hypothetical protein